METEQQVSGKKRKRSRSKRTKAPAGPSATVVANGSDDTDPIAAEASVTAESIEPEVVHTAEDGGKEEEPSDAEAEDHREAKRVKIPQELQDQLSYKNRERVLVFSTRGITHKERLLMNDIRRLLPHCKKEGKFEGKNALSEIPKICEMKNCNNCIFFESRKRKDLYMWLCKTPNGPCCKFLVTGVHPMSDLRLTGNCLKSSRPLLSFSKHFDIHPHYQLVKELLVQVFNTPKGHPKSKPFVDHVLMFSIQGGMVWFRHYQILENDKGTQDLVEIGPRFVMQLIRIFDGTFGGQTLYKNPDFINPNKIRAARSKRQSGKYIKRVQDRKIKTDRDTVLFKNIPVDNRDDLFNNPPPKGSNE